LTKLNPLNIRLFHLLHLVNFDLKPLPQTPKKINVEHSDYFDVNQTAIPDAVLLTGNVRK
jgi:hypothetical protein